MRRSQETRDRAGRPPDERKAQLPSYTELKEQVAQLQVLQEPKVRIAVAREDGVARTAR